MIQTLFRFATACAVAAAVGTAAGRAATPTFWLVSSQAELLKGDVENLSIDSDGRLVLGPVIDAVHDTTAPFLWTLRPAPDGGFWIGSGNEGKVFLVDRAGRASVLFDAPELEVHALAEAPGGGLYVGTSPDGKIYRVARDGAAEVFFEPGEKYIWAIAVDSDGTVYAATGEKGMIYRIAPDGTGAPFYATRASNVVSLAFDRAGRLLAGTEGPGRVFRIERDGKPFVLLDSDFREIHALHVAHDGVIFAAAISARPSAEERPAPERPEPEPVRPPVPSVSTEITAISIVDAGGPPGPPPATRTRRPDRGTLKGAVYRIMPDGLWDTVWESTEDSPYDLALVDEGLLIGTGSGGKIYRVAGEPSKATLLGRATAQQVTRFFRDARGEVYFVTSNPGRLFRLSAGRAPRGTYDSEVRDAGTIAAWGSIRWRATANQGQIQLFTRSGNTSTPDETWSEWAGPYVDSDGEQIGSPKARYLQWRAVLADGNPAPVLTSVTAAYLQRNLRPEVTSITVYPPGAVFQKPFSTGELEIAGYEEATSDGRSSLLAGPAQQQQPSPSQQPAPALGRRLYQKGLQTFVWTAEDPNDDRLQYDVRYRREGDENWKVLKEGLWEPILTWDTTSVPDGTYTIKVVASDAPSNSPGTALTGEFESPPFDIDNTPPRIEVSSIRQARDRTVIEFVVRDDHSPVHRVEYSTDANRWKVIFPKDGIADSRVEEFELVLEGGQQARSAIIRATDAMNNSATAVAEMNR